MINVIANILIGLLTLLAYLPMCVLYMFSDMIFFVIYNVCHYRLEVVRKNLKRSFPDYTNGQLMQLERQSYRNMCDLMVEELKMLHMSQKERERRIVVKGAELIAQAAAMKRPVFIFIGHIGNWEWALDFSSHVKPPLTRGCIYHPLSIKLTDLILIKLRDRFYPNSYQIPQKVAVRTLYHLKKEFGSFQIALNSDQCPIFQSLDHWMTFMNQDTPYIVGGEEIGRRLNAKFLMFHMSKPKRGYYEVTITDIPLSDEELAHKKYPYTEAYMRHLEKNIREQPEIYLWTHNRWKYRRVFYPDGTWKNCDTRKDPKPVVNS